MIQRAFITAWRASAPWPTDAQVEQDLILSRVLVELFRNPAITEALAFRGGADVDAHYSRGLEERRPAQVRFQARKTGLSEESGLQARYWLMFDHG